MASFISTGNAGHCVDNKISRFPCYDFNCKGKCFKLSCIFRHICIRCQLKHPVINCFNNSSYTGNRISAVGQQSSGYGTPYPQNRIQQTNKGSVHLQKPLQVRQ